MLRARLEEQHLFIKVFDYAPIGMALGSSDGKLLKVNQSLCKILGYTQDELTNLSFQSITYPDDIEANMELRRKAIAGEIDSYEMEKRFVHKSGEVIWGLLSVTVERDELGNLGFFIAQLVDITEQKKKEEELKKIQELHQHISEHSQDILIRITSEGIITYVSPAVCNQLGYAPEELIGKYSYHFWHPEDVDNWLKQGSQDSRKSIFRIRHKNGHYVWQESNSKKIRNEAGEIQHVIAVCRDITESRKNEELIRRSEKLSVVGELAAGIAHEIRNPLTSIRGFVQLFKSEDTSGLKRVRHEVMLKEIDRINDIVSELLVLAKPSSDTFQLGNVYEELDHVITLFEGQANLYNIEIKKDFDEHLPLIFSQGTLKQVFINILKNAIESMPNGGEVLIQARKLDDKVCIRFIDHGCGIPADTLARIGSPFFTTKESGTGLGLMVCHRIIHNHNGTMRFESEPGKGTSVEVILPVYNTIS